MYAATDAVDFVLTTPQARLLDLLPEGTRIYTSEIRCHPGTWYTIQCRGHVLAREDDLTMALVEAIATYKGK